MAKFSVGDIVEYRGTEIQITGEVLECITDYHIKVQIITTNNTGLYPVGYILHKTHTSLYHPLPSLCDLLIAAIDKLIDDERTI